MKDYLATQETMEELKVRLLPTYVCNDCGTAYDSKEEAKNCECAEFNPNERHTLRLSFNEWLQMSCSITCYCNMVWWKYKGQLYNTKQLYPIYLKQYSS